jgi:hypothetical protein
VGALSPVHLLILLIVVVLPIVAIVLIVVAVRRSARDRPAGQPGTSAMPPDPPRVIATFGPATGWEGRQITYLQGQFILQDHGAITAAHVLDYDAKGQLTWAYDGLREWVVSLAAAGTSSGR